MDNWNAFLEKKVNVSVAFSKAYVDGGSVPHVYSGIVKSINNDSIILSDVSTVQGFNKTVNLNNILINKNYIIYIEEM